MLFICDFPFPEKARWIPGDQYLRKPLRKFLEPFRGMPPGGLRKVTTNLIAGLERSDVPFKLIRNISEVPENELVSIIHGPLDTCKLIAERQACVTGPGILNGAREWPDLFENSKCLFHIQNCEWAARMYEPQFSSKIRIWTMGVDEEKFMPVREQAQFDFLIYDKIRWRRNKEYSGLLEHCSQVLESKGCSIQYIRYGEYPGGRESAYHRMLGECRAMLYLSENETQGFAYNEAMSMDVPILAWNIGKWCDPMRFELGQENVIASSVPYFDERCGLEFRGASDFEQKLDVFLENLNEGRYAPRDYVLDNLRLEQAARRFVNLIGEAKQLHGITE